MQETFYNLEEVAEKLRISTKTVTREITKGHMQGSQFGRQWRFTDDQVNAYIESRTVRYKKKKTA